MRSRSTSTNSGENKRDGLGERRNEKMMTEEKV